MIVHKVSQSTNRLNSMDLDISLTQLADWLLYKTDTQDCFPQLSEEECVFLETGMTPKEQETEKLLKSVNYE